MSRLYSITFLLDPQYEVQPVLQQKTTKMYKLVKMEVSGRLRAAATLHPGTHWINGWARAGWDEVERKKYSVLPGIEP
jgi:hypothetical protein